MENNMENYKMINAEMSKTIAALKGEVTRLKDENKKITVDSLCAQNQIFRLKKEIADSQRIYLDHVNVLITELQLFVCKVNNIVVIENNNNNNERNQLGDQSSTNVSGSRRLSRSYESPVRQRSAFYAKNVDEENGLDTITEEIEENYVIKTTQNTTPSTHCQSTIANPKSIQNSILNLEASSTSIQSDDNSVANINLTASYSDSNMENQSSKSVKKLKQTEYFGALSPLSNGDFVTMCHKQQGVLDHSNQDIGISGVVSSTPYKRNTIIGKFVLLNESVDETGVERNVANTRSKSIRNTTKSPLTLSNNSTTIEAQTKPPKRVKNANKIFSTLSNDTTALKTESMTTELNNTRPKRKASQAITFKEPNLNTKLRRPLSMEPKFSAKPKGPLN